MPDYVAYIVAFSAMLFAALSGLTLITCVRHLDPETAPPMGTRVPDQEKVAV